MFFNYKQDPGDFRPRLYARGLGMILGESIYIYFARILQMMIISAVVQAPVYMVSYTASQSQSLALSVAVALIGGVAGTAVYAATVIAVGQCFAFRIVSVRGCYARVAWRGVSLLTFGALYAAVFAAMAFPLETFTAWSEEFAAFAESAASAESSVAPNPSGTPTAPEAITLGTPTAPTAPEPPPMPATALLAILALAALSMLGGIYMTTIIPSIALEGRSGFGALTRGFRLARGSEWRILGHSIVYLAVFVGIAVALALPYVVFSAIIGDAGPLYAAGVTLAATVAQPVLYIAATLLYFDIRLKKEGYDEARLSAEMGVWTPPRQNQDKEG